jgi:hypothetical protein
MDATQSLLLDALRAAAGHDGEIRLYRSGKLPGLFAARTTAHAEAAAHGLRDGLIEVVRSETRGKTVAEFVRVTPKGLDIVVKNESPARAMDELRDVLATNGQNLPGLVAEIRRELEALTRHSVDEVTRIGKRLDRLAEQVEAALRKAETQRLAAPVAWGPAALEYLDGHRKVTGQGGCPLPKLFAALLEYQHDLGIKEFHAGLRGMQQHGLLRLLPYDAADGPPQPEYALPDGEALLYYVAPPEERH